MEVLLFFGFIIFAIISSAKKQAKEAESVDTPSLDDIFNEAMKTASNNRSSNSGSGFSEFAKSTEGRNYNRNSGAQKKSKKKAERQVKAPSSESLVKPTVHGGNDHDCDEVNYDQMDSLMGGLGSFNLGANAASTPAYQSVRAPEFKMSRDDLLKSFIMSEVLQRYDINRIYSRIPPIKSDD